MIAVAPDVACPGMGKEWCRGGVAAVGLGLGGGLQPVHHRPHLIHPHPRSRRAADGAWLKQAPRHDRAPQARWAGFSLSTIGHASSARSCVRAAADGAWLKPGTTPRPGAPQSRWRASACPRPATRRRSLPAQQIPATRTYTRSVIDLHSHVLPGIDDGATDMEQTLELLRTMEEDGIEVVAATPHVHERWPTAPETMEEGVAAVREAAAAEGLRIDVRPGGEIALDRLAYLDRASRARFGLAGNPRLLLVEFPLWGWPLSLVFDCQELLRAGIVPLVAHPERNADVQSEPGRIRDLVDAGAYVQLTAASVDGRLGKRAAECSAALLGRGLAHVIASDAHAPLTRAAGLSDAAVAAGGGALGRWLTYDVPAALVAGDTPPARPETTRPRKAWWRR